MSIENQNEINSINLGKPKVMRSYDSNNNKNSSKNIDS